MIHQSTPSFSDLQTRTASGDADNPAPILKSEDSLNMSRVIFRSIKITLVSVKTPLFIGVGE
jgi:hypothetical protein